MSTMKKQIAKSAGMTDGNGGNGSDNASSSSSDSFSSDSDDEFLAQQQGGKHVDREELVRKKLLENFYGKSVISNTNGGGDDDDSDSSDDDDNNAGRKKQRKKPSSVHGGGSTDDLDSTDFDAVRHTEYHVLNDSVHPMLELEESLAGQVRTLDSSMQTLVYENYSRFIEASDAVRSIGVNVQANQSNLQTLNTSVTSVAQTARSIELHVGPLRDELVEKIRVKRLLQRLDSLLKLPDTLRDSIASGKYRWATKKYLTAYSILSKHSDGFESLQKIETECYDIMQVMLSDVKSNLMHWSGTMLVTASSAEDEDEVCAGNTQYSMDEEDNPTSSTESQKLAPNDSEEDDDPPDPPKEVSEIFECAGTPTLILDHQTMKKSQHASLSSQKLNASVPSSPPGIDRATSMVEFDPGLSVQQCKDMSLKACLRLLERFLDTHHIELQESQLALSDDPNDLSTNVIGGVGVDGVALPTPIDPATSSSPVQLIPTNVLDSILEAAALYSMTFPLVDHASGVSEELSQFVSTAFYSFLQHVRAELLEMSVQAFPKDLKRLIEKVESFEESENGGLDTAGQNPLADDVSDKDFGDSDDHQQDSDEKAYEQISAATTLLLDSVRQLSSGLSLPEIAVSADLASSFVEQTVGLTEGMVKKKVDQKFYTLRIRVIEDCLAPFYRNSLKVDVDAVDDPATGSDQRLQMVQMAAVALSDAMQLVDDTVRSVLEPRSSSAAGESPSSSREDTMMLKVAVEQSTKRFASWFADAMETMVGCESSDQSRVVDVFPDASDPTGASEDIFTVIGTLSTLPLDVPADEADDLSNIVQSCMSRMIGEATSVDATSTRSNFILAVVDMCRQAERTVMDDINASIATHSGTSNKQRNAKTSLFATSAGNSTGKSQSPISERFGLSLSRVLSMYAMDLGNDAAKKLCMALPSLSSEDYVVVSGPRECVWSTLALVKEASMECGDVFGEPKMAGPMPETLEDEYQSLTATRQPHTLRSDLVSDVERLFVEEVVVYPSPYEKIEPCRNAVVTLLLKVAFKALLEDTRTSRFSISGYRQLLVDLEFLRFMLPHFVADENLRDGSNARSALETLLTQTTKCAEERCKSSAMLQDSTSETNQARSVIRGFLTENSGENGIIKKLTID